MEVIMKNIVYNPGCALLLYKLEYSEKILTILRKKYPEINLHTICCKHDPNLPSGTTIINTCAGCDRRFSNLYEGIDTISLWEILAENDLCEFPDYKGLEVSVHDACPIRTKPQVHKAIRTLLDKMNIKIIETKYNGTHSICCGDDFYPSLPVEKVHEKMKERASSMPCDEVCVYCISCIKSMHIGGKKPRYILDLLFEEQSDPQVYDTVKWHDMLNEWIKEH